MCMREGAALPDTKGVLTLETGVLVLETNEVALKIHVPLGMVRLRPTFWSSVGASDILFLGDLRSEE